MKIVSRCLFCICVSFAWACSDPAGLERDTGAPMQTGALEYTLIPWVIAPDKGYQTTISYSFTNRSGRPIYLVNCQEPGFLLERRDNDGTWTRVWGGPGYRCLSPPIVIAPEDSISGVVLPQGAYPPGQDLLPEWNTPSLEGVYRLRFSSAIFLDDPGDYPDGEPVPVDEIRSNPFRIVR